MSKAWRNVSKELDAECRRAETIIFNTSILVLYREGWRRLRIERFLEKANDVYGECASSLQKSLVQMCDEQLGIELRNDSNESYKDTPYLSYEDWQNKKEQVLHKMNKVQQNCYIIRVRQKMISWMFPQIMASVLLALRKKENWGIDKIAEFASKVQEVRDQYNDEIKDIKAAVIEETGIEYEWIEGMIKLKGND